MSEKHPIWVNYDTSETDLSCVTCIESNNGRAKMLVGYIEKDADEVYKIVSEQGYLNKHDLEIRADERRKFAEWLQSNGYYVYVMSTPDGIFTEEVTVDEIISEYEKEQENE